MCGIFGKFVFNGNIDINESLEALTMLRHRGPDGFGIEIGQSSNKKYILSHNQAAHIQDFKGNYFLGHRRLSIIDLNVDAFQPMESFNKRFSITFNGEIYNYIELRDKLIKLGHTFKTDHSDTEVLLNAYIAWGKSCLDQLRGMFAFAIYDRKENSLFIARDRIGKKTLYFELSNNSFQFSSELRSIISFGPKRTINKEALNFYLAFGYIPHPYSIFDDIKKLPPASFALIDLNKRKINIQEYWDINELASPNMSYDDALTIADTSLTESVSLRLRADVPIGAFISGGIDSTLVIKKITETSKTKFELYGADFPNTDRSERKYIEEATNRYSQKLNLSKIDLSHTSEIDSIISVFDEPFDGASSIAVFDLFKQASKKHKVILTGDGGDEMFAGYDRYLNLKQRYSKIIKAKKLLIPGIILSFIRKLGIKNSRLKQLDMMIKGDLFDNYAILNSDHDLRALVKTEIKIDNLYRLEPFITIRKKLKDKGFSIIKSLQYIDIKTILPGRMLYKIDRFSMFYGVEARSPFLDHKLAEKAFTIPDEKTISGNTPKSLLKNILREDFSNEFIDREKKGFGNPLSNWFRNSNTNEVFPIIQNPTSIIYNYIDYNKTQRLFPKLEDGCKSGQEKDLWRVLVLAKFLENHKNRIK